MNVKVLKYYFVFTYKVYKVLLTKHAMMFILTL